MANEFTGAEDKENIYYTGLQAHMELLEALLEADDAPYPWNPAAPESEAYFASREQELLLEGWLEEEMATLESYPTATPTETNGHSTQSQTFFNQLDQLWSTITAADGGNVDECADGKDLNTLQVTLQQRFAPRVPQNWLDAIAYQAHQVFSSQRSIADQMVQCVQNLLPNWAEEDLLVLARPFAYAMRGSKTEASEFVLSNISSQDWTALSEIEQARLSLALARYALVQLHSLPENEL